MFLKIKMHLRGQFFEDISTIQVNVTRELKAVPKEDYYNSFQLLHLRSKTCIKRGGDYVEGNKKK